MNKNLKTLFLHLIKSKVFENYASMTSANMLGMFIGILIYPYLIRMLGKESYGLYVFASSITGFFGVFIEFGFGLPAMKLIIENRNNQSSKQKTLSSIFSAQMFLWLVSLLIFIPLCLARPLFRQNFTIFALCYINILLGFFFPSWYFQAIQKMKIISILQVVLRLLTVPFFLLLIKNPTHILIYVVIQNIVSFITGLYATIFLQKTEKVFPRFVAIKSLKPFLKNALPFFWANSASTIKMNSITLIIGTFFGVADVAIYDLANKIVSIPRQLTSNLNVAIFPKAAAEKSKSFITKIIKYETLISFVYIALIAIFGYWIVSFLGGSEMLDAYPITVVLSINIFTWLVVGCYINFVFVPFNRSDLVSKCKLVEFISLIVLQVIGLLIFKSIIVVVAAVVLSELIETLYCVYATKKSRLL